MVHATLVVDEEWPLMAAASMSVEARRAVLEITRSLDRFEP